MSRDRSGGTIPLPRFTILLIGAVLIGGSLVAWKIWQDEQQAQVTAIPPPASIQRARRVEAWTEMGAAALPDLRLALGSEDVRTRRDGALAASRIGPDAGDLAPVLAGLLKDEDEQVRLSALNALIRMEYPLAQETPTLGVLMSTGGSELRLRAAEALLQVDEAGIPVLCGVLESSEPDARWYATRLLGRLGQENPDAVRAIHRATHDGDDRVRHLAFRILIHWKDIHSDEAIAALQDSNTQIVSDVARSTARLGLEADDLLPHVVPLLEREETRSAALEALWGFGERARTTAPRVAGLLQSEPKHGRELVLRTLGRIAVGQDSIAATVEPYLIEKSERGYYARVAAETLRQISPDRARAAVPKLVREFQDGDVRRQELAIAALSGLAPEAREAIPTLILALDHPTDWTRMHAAEALGLIGPPAAAAIPHLNQLASAAPDDRLRPGVTAMVDTMARARAVQALARIAAGNAQAIQAIIQATRHSEKYVRATAIRVLPESKCPAETAIPLCVAALSDAEREVRVCGILSLGAYPEEEAVIPLLESALLDDNGSIRAAAAQAIGKFGPSAKSVVPVLVSLLSHSENRPRSLSPAAGDEFAIGMEYEFGASAHENVWRLWQPEFLPEKQAAIVALRQISPDAATEVSAQ